MRITIKLHAVLRTFQPPGTSGDGGVSEVADGSTVAQVLERLGIPPKHAGVLVSGDECLEIASMPQDGPELSMFPPMAGAWDVRGGVDDGDGSESV